MCFDLIRSFVLVLVLPLECCRTGFAGFVLLVPVLSAVTWQRVLWEPKRRMPCLSPSNILCHYLAAVVEALAAIPRAALLVFRPSVDLLPDLPLVFAGIVTVSYSLYVVMLKKECSM